MQQKNNTDYTILLLAIIFIIAALCSCKKQDTNQGHQCRWNLCPYKGVTPDKNGKAVRQYTGTDGGDSYSIDILHLEYPQANYDELEQMLFED